MEIRELAKAGIYPTDNAAFPDDRSMTSHEACIRSRAF